MCAAAARVLGLCGGYQMLGRTHRRSRRHRRPGRRRRRARPARRRDRADRRQAARAGRGHEASTARRFAATRCIWARPTGRIARARSPRSPTARPDGAVSADGRVAGTYVHGLFADDRQRAAWLARLGAGPRRRSPTRRSSRRRSTRSPRISRAHLDLDRLLKLVAMSQRDDAATSAISSASARR